MKLRRHTKITGLLLALSLAVAALLFALPFYLFSDQMLAARLTSGIQKGIDHTGLKLEIGSVRWVDWNHLTARRVVLRDSLSGAQPLRVERVNFRFNIFSLLKNYHYPEACLRQVEFVRPVVRVYRIDAATWNWQYYFRNPHRELRFHTVFLVKQGRIELQDQRFGRRLAQNVNGRINLKDYPLVKWDLDGGMAGQVDLNWSSRGQTKIRHHYGNGEVLLKQAPLTELAVFLPYSEQYQIRSGLVDLKLRFTWDKKGFQVQQGRIKLTEAWLAWERSEQLLRLRLVEAEFTPQQIRVDRAQLAYEQSLIKLAGAYNRQTGAIHASINADPLDLAALARFLPALRPYAPAGIGRAYLTAAGSWQKPVINGTILLEQGQVSLAGKERITEINGRITVEHNQLQILKLAGVWRQLRLGLAGEINNLWHPELNLQLTGTGLRLDQFGQSYPELTGLNRIHTGNTSFSATVRGSLQLPVLDGELEIDRVSFNEYSITNFRTKFNWDHPTHSLVLREYYGELWGGQLAGSGLVRFQPDQSSWLIKGELSRFNLAEVSPKQLPGLKGYGSATTLTLQGAWRKGEPFDPGLVQGRLQSRNLSYYDLYLESLEADFNWHDQSLTVSTITATAANGAINGRLTWQDQHLLLELNAAGIKLRPFLPDTEKYPFDGVFEGSLVLWGPLTQLEGNLEGIFTTATWGNKPIGTIRGALVYRNQRIGVTDLQIDSEIGIFMVNGGIDWEQWGAEPSLDLELHSNNLNLNGLQRWLPWKQNLPLDGTGQMRLTVTGGASRPRFEGELGLNQPGWGSLVFEQGMLKFTSNQQGSIRAELQLTSPGSYINASGTIDQGQCDLVFTGGGIDLSLFPLNYQAQPLRGKIMLVGRIGGSLTDPLINAALTSADLAWGDLQKISLTAELQGDRNRILLNSAEFSSGEGTLRAQGQIALAHPAQLDLDLFLNNLKLTDLLGLLGSPTLNITGQVSGRVKLTGTTANPIWGIRGSLYQGSFNTIPVSGEFDLGYQRNQLTLERVYLKHHQGSLVASGSWKKNELAQLKLQLVDFPIQTLQPWWPTGKDWSGLINATVSGSWAPQRVDGKIVASLNQLNYKKQALGDLRLKGDFSDQGLAIEEAWLNCQNGHLSAKGYLPWPKGWGSSWGRAATSGPGNRKLDLRLNLRNAPAELANLFSQNYLITKGKLDGRLYLKKSWEQMELSGKLDGDDLELNLSVLPLPITDLELAVTIEANRANIRRAVGNYGSGKFDLNGTVILDGFKPVGFSLNLTGKKIYYRNQYLDGYGDLDLKLAGGFSDALLSGEIVLHHCKLGILGSRPPRRNRQFRPRLELMVHTAQDVRYRQAGFADVTIKGSLQITGVLGAMVLNGEVVAKRGILTLYGQTFKVDRGKAVFKNSQGFKPYLDLEARYTHPEADVFLTIRGQVGTDLSLNLSSQPYLPQQNLIALINWEDQRDGRPLPPNNTAPLGNGDLNLVADSVLSELFYNIRSAMQVDYLYLEHDYYQDELRINIGQYLTDKLFLAYSRSVSNTTTPNQQWSFDYSLTSKVKAGGTFSETEGAFWRLLYRIHF